jgi:hypothetical protein
MIPQWPTTLPQLLEAAGYARSAADVTLRTAMDAGPAKVRRRFSAGPQPVSGRITLTDAQLATFHAWFRDSLLGGALRFSWTDPDSQEPVEMRFTGPPTWTARDSNLYHLQLPLEILP